MRLIKLTVALVLVGFSFLSLVNGNPEPEVGTKIGDQAPEIRTTLINGEYFNLEDLKGKMVLIDFWASYDANSRIGNHLKSGWIENFQNQSFQNGNGFTIVSVSLDRFKNPLKTAIQSDSMTYPYHICDYKGADSELVAVYRANDMKKVLIDGDGRIVAVSNNMDEIASALTRLSVNE